MVIAVEPDAERFGRVQERNGNGTVSLAVERVPVLALEAGIIIDVVERALVDSALIAQTVQVLKLHRETWVALDALFLTVSVDIAIGQVALHAAEMHK